MPYAEECPWQNSFLWQYVENIIKELAKEYGFMEVRTPLVEHTELFQKGAGESSDVVFKEMYTFLDKAERSLSLRPEGTAAVMRAFIENNLISLGKVHKLYYVESMFRYERPQAGRYRQHHQFGVEAIGLDSYAQDAEIIDMFYEFCRRLKIRNCIVMINSLGDFEGRQNYKNALKKYLEPSLSFLSKESQARFYKNPLRILDSKELEDQTLIKNAPSILDFLSDKERKHFDNLQKLLSDMKIPFVVNERLVRGFDYYDSTIFEVISKDIGAQNAIGGGGRYNNLLKSFHGPDLPGIGFGAGIERILQVMIEQGSVPADIKASPFIYFIPLVEEANKICFLNAMHLRHEKVPVEVDFDVKRINHALKRASDLKASYCLIIGEDEIKKGRAQLKDMVSRNQQEVIIDDLINFIKNLWKSTKERTPAAN
jgi:histidyl-tRNA synthetase